MYVIALPKTVLNCCDFFHKRWNAGQYHVYKSYMYCIKQTGRALWRISPTWGTINRVYNKLCALNLGSNKNTSLPVQRFFLGRFCAWWELRSHALCMCADWTDREVGWLRSVGARAKVRRECEKGSDRAVKRSVFSVGMILNPPPPSPGNCFTEGWIKHHTDH